MSDDAFQPNYSSTSPLKEVKEVRYLIEQAFKIAPVMTLTMLKAHLNARVQKRTRVLVIQSMMTEGLVEMEKVHTTNFFGRRSQVTVLKWINNEGVDKSRKTIEPLALSAAPMSLE